MSADPLLLGLAPVPVAPNKPRSALLAGVMTLFCPGLGHFYCGRVVASIAWAVVPYLAVMGAMGAGVFAPAKLPMLTAIGVGCWALVRLLQTVDAVRVARRSRTYAPRPYNHLALYLGFFLGTSGLTSLLASPFRGWVLEPYKNPTSSMAPTLVPGDQFYVLKAGPFSAIRRGDIIVYWHKSREEGALPVNFIKRVVGLPGDQIELRNNVLWVNGVAEPTVECDPPEVTVDEGPGGRPSVRPCWVEGTHRILLGGRYFSDAEAVTVPPDSYYVLGDNRNNSVDSREEGPVPFEDVVGRAAVVWLSLGPSWNIRWERIGLQL